MRNMQALVALVALSLSGGAYADVQNYELPIVNKQLAPDGVWRQTSVADGVFPAPLITGFKDDQFLINVTSLLTDPTLHRSTSIHWHGLLQATTNQMDGGAFVNQCPIVPDHSFLYNFTAVGQAGTFWYHSHLAAQYCDGLRGAFVIYDPDDPHLDLYDVDEEDTVITLADWYHTQSTVAFPEVSLNFPVPDSTLINGVGRWKDGDYGDGENLAVINVDPDVRYRFRIVSTSCSPSWVFSIDNHKLLVIEADGVSTKPVEVDSLEIFAGQRYSVVVKADQDIGNYWIRANPAFAVAPNLEAESFAGGINSAILRYTGADSTEPAPAGPQEVGHLLDEVELHPLDSENPGAPGEPYPGGVDYPLELTAAQNTTNHNLVVNGVSFSPPTVPVLLQILNHQTPLLPEGSIYPLERDQVVEINIPGGFPHPFHLHGHVFDVVRSANSDILNYVDPVRRDVVSVGRGPGNNVTIRFKTDNPGPWFLHCHIDWHLEAGMAVVFAERVDETEEANPVGQDWLDLCPLYEEENPDLAFNHTLDG